MDTSVQDRSSAGLSMDGRFTRSGDPYRYGTRMNNANANPHLSITWQLYGRKCTPTSEFKEYNKEYN